jgi:acyl-CoA thioesterase I
VSHLTIFALALGAASVLIPATSVSHDAAPTAAPNVARPSASTTNSAVSHPSSMELPRLGQALRATHTAKVLAIGSSSTVGVGASSPSHTYVARLETGLESTLKGTDFEIIGHGLSGEVAQGAADRMKREVEQVKPDLVIWQVGTNDALRHVAMDSFKDCLKKTLAWLKEQQIDVILINPQYGESLVKDAYYEDVVAAVAAIAREEQVLVVDRFEALRKLHRQRGDQVYLSTDNLHMNDEGYRWLAEQLAATIINALPQGPGNVDQSRTATSSSTIAETKGTSSP